MLFKKVDFESLYPSAYKPCKVGKYPAFVKSGGGFFYDEVLEYRVWIHPECGGEDIYNGSDYFYSFATYEEALDFSKSANGAEEPLVLVLQREYINEPELNQFIHIKEKRITEWQTEWLKDSKRNKDSISNFLIEHKKRKYLEPWILIDNGEIYETELCKEVSQGHLLFQIKVKAIARRRDRDDVLFEMKSNQYSFALVHITWSGKKEKDIKWPYTEFFKTWDEWESKMKEINEEFIEFNN
jgi:predicted CopG family antitoxin